MLGLSGTIPGLPWDGYMGLDTLVVLKKEYTEWPNVSNTQPLASSRTW